MKTLYVSDLDGTLLRSDARISDYTNDVINRLTAAGMLFTYATARSIYTASQATRGLTAQIPLITHNGTMVLDNVSQKLLFFNSFSRQDAAEILACLLENDIFPIVYAYDRQEHFSYLPGRLNQKTESFIATRKNDVRNRPISRWEQLLEGRVHYFTCIDEEEKLRPLYERYRDRFHCFFQPEIYSGDTFFEIIPREASKANAALQLKKLLGAERVAAFGDGENDLDLFEIADEAYAVSNASKKLKAAATGIIGSSDEDSVAKWLEAHAEF